MLARVHGNVPPYIVHYTSFAFGVAKYEISPITNFLMSAVRVDSYATTLTNYKHM